MTKLLLKLFVKCEGGQRERERAGTLSGFVCITLNVLLATAKILVGLLFGIISVFADGMNNLTDCGSNVVSLVSIKMANKPADKEHPFGHARIEYIASMIVAFIVLMLAYEIGSEAIMKIFAPEVADFTNVWWLVITLALSVIIKFWLFLFNRRLGKSYDSELLQATATDSISDSISTTAVLIAVLVNYFTGNALPWLDGVMGTAVAVFIAIAGIKLFKETMSQLVGEAPTAELIREVEGRIKKYDGVLGMHDLNVHNYGPNKYFASVHVEVDSNVPVLDSHDMIDEIERDFAQNTNVVMVIHLDPIVVGDSELDEYKEKIGAFIKGLDERYNMHDFRMVRGVTHTNLIFDVATPFDSIMSESEIKTALDEYANTFENKVYIVATVEKQVG